MVDVKNISVDQIWNMLKDVPDPEVPVLTVQDLGIIRDIHLRDEVVEVVITPTYSYWKMVLKIFRSPRFFRRRGRPTG